MDPVIRVICLIVLTGALSRNHLDVFLFCTFIVVSLHIVTRHLFITSHLKLINRMRWFFLALMIMYFWFTPGTPALNMAWSPTVEGLEQGGLRAGSLILVIIAINLMIQTTPKEQILGALYWILAPFKLAGLPRDKFMLRMTLTLETLSELQPVIEQRKEQAGTTLQGRFKNIINSTSDIFNTIIHKAENEPERSVTIPLTASPPVVQWLFPFMFLFSIILIYVY